MIDSKSLLLALAALFREMSRFDGTGCVHCGAESILPGDPMVWLKTLSGYVPSPELMDMVNDV